MKNILTIRNTFFFIFLLLNIYFLVIKSELYESKTAVLVRDLSATSSITDGALSLFSSVPNTQLQDSMVVEEYLMSLDVFTLLDKKFNLTQHYQSNNLDFIERLGNNAEIEEILDFYRNRLLIQHDEMSGIMHIGFSHTNPQKSQEILEYLIKQVQFELNEFNRRKAKKQLTFIELEYKKNKDKLHSSSALLEEYQNKHLLLNPENQAISSTTMIASLEATLTQKKIELSTKKAYLNNDSYEIISLKREISEINNSLLNKKKSLAGSDTTRLNKVLFEYEKLKMQFEFDKQVYTNALIQLETIKLDALKEAKTLSVVSKPNLPEGYTYPDKPKVFITITIVLLLIYGIFSMLYAIIKDHKE